MKLTWKCVCELTLIFRTHFLLFCQKRNFTVQCLSNKTTPPSYKSNMFSYIPRSFHRFLGRNILIIILYARISFGGLLIHFVSCIYYFIQHPPDQIQQGKISPLIAEAYNVKIHLECKNCRKGDDLDFCKEEEEEDKNSFVLRILCYYFRSGILFELDPINLDKNSLHIEPHEYLAYLY